ncbi:2-oxoglutarate dehydrogenase, E2 component, dihydrolipoamide succinyltransferase [Agrococcus lahaulensis]|uniref:2-oxoglutarate dehydrogenase, E2 component, dihydrolipoamide succinyltransferase n=1 Tax=Agrococcus lahaulensis TaxID=341722 RepID=UPI000421189F|nr:2-oxoglutarate dehydrogenase, E2 component, dihydrolipoamide succinyltransferase [Agrococcus lahaulensis]
MTDIKLPELGESVTEGTITRWLKAVGDEIAVDEPLVEISTDKVDTEVPSPIAGTLTEILADEDDTVEVGAVIARVGDAGDAPAEQAPETDAEAATEGTDAEPEQEADDESAAEAQESPSKEADEAQQEAPEPAPQAEAQPSSGGGTDIKLPELGESVTEGTIIRWLKAVGDEIEVDEPIVEISTDKVDTEVPSPVAGTISELLVDEDDTVEVGSVIARVGGSASAPSGGEPTTDDAETDEPAPSSSSAEEQDATPAEQPEPAKPSTEQPEPAKAPEAEEQEAAPAPEAPKQEAPKAEAPKQPAPPAPSKPAPSDSAAQAAAAPSASASPAQPAAQSASAGVYVTPIVRKLANERGVDLGSITGTGVGGRIRKEDVLAAAEAKPAESAQAAPAAAAAPAPVEVSPLRGTTAKMSRLRKVVAKRAVESMQELAQLTTVVEVDVTKVAQLREAKKASFQQETGNKLTFLPFFTQAAVEALKAHPLINATDDGETITYPETENLAMAVDTERGLLTPVIRDASSKSIRELTAEIADLAQRTRDNQLKPDELAGGTFTLTNTGSRGALFDTPVVFQPQRAILGVGTVVKRPVVVSVDGQDSIAIRSMVYLALSYDHRIIDGADAARYLAAVKQRLESGAFEV